MYSENEEVSLNMGTYDSSEAPKQESTDGYMTSEMQSQIAGTMFQLGTGKAKEAFALYGRIDILRPYFDTEPADVQKRLISALIPEKITGTKPIVVSELYGPLMVVLTLIAVMLAGLKAHGQTVQEGTLMGTAIGTCFGYWFGSSLFFFGLAYFCDTALSAIEILSLCGYGLFGTLLCMFLSTLLVTSASNLFFYATWGVLGVSSAFRMGNIFLERTTVRKQGLTVGVVVASVHLLFILYLKFVYHKTYEAASKLAVTG